MRKRVKLLLWSDIMFMVAGGMLGPIYAIFVQDIGGDILTAGGAWAAFAFATGLLILLMGKIEEHKKKILMVVMGSSLKALAFIGYIFVSNPYELFGVQILLGIGVAINMPAWDTLYGKLIEKGRESFYWGLWEASSYLVSAIAGLAGAAIVMWFGFKTLFVLMAIASIAGLFLAVHLLKRIRL